jgi:hypothetical protein
VTWHKPFGIAEVEYVQAHYPDMSCEAIAEKLGRSRRGVYNLVKRLGLRDSCAPARADESRMRAREGGSPDVVEEIADAVMSVVGDDEPQDELAELRAQKRFINRVMRENARAADVPKLSAELREIRRRIAELEGESDGDGKSSASDFDSIFLSFPLHPA